MEAERAQTFDDLSDRSEMIRRVVPVTNPRDRSPAVGLRKRPGARRSSPARRARPRRRRTADSRRCVALLGATAAAPRHPGTRCASSPPRTTSRCALVRLGSPRLWPSPRRSSSTILLSAKQKCQPPRRSEIRGQPPLRNRCQAACLGAAPSRSRETRVFESPGVLELGVSRSTLPDLDRTVPGFGRSASLATIDFSPLVAGARAPARAPRSARRAPRPRSSAGSVRDRPRCDARSRRRRRGSGGRPSEGRSPVDRDRSPSARAPAPAVPPARVPAESRDPHRCPGAPGETRPRGATRVHVAVSLAREAEARHRCVQLGELDPPLEHEVHVPRGVGTTGVDSGAGPSRQDGPNPVHGERLADREGERLERGARGDPRAGFPVARGRRRSRLTAARRSGSASESRAR